MGKNKISEKKLFMMLSIELFAMTSLILPAVLIGFSGKNGLPVLLAASGFMLILAFWYWNLGQKVKKSPDELLLSPKNNLMNRCFRAVYMIRFFFHALFLIVIFVNLIGQVLLPGYDLYSILLPILALVWYMGGKQLRIRGRVMEVLFPFIFIPLLIVLFFALFQAGDENLFHMLWADTGVGLKKEFWHSVYGVLIFYQPVEFILFLMPALEGAKGKRTLWAACIFAAAINVIVYVSAVGLFGTVRTGEKLWSALYIMQSVRLPGRFVERLDILFLVFWIFSSFALVSAYMYYGSRFAVWENVDETGCLKKRYGWYLAIWSLGILILTVGIREPDRIFKLFVPYKMWIDFPLSILLPAVLYGRKKGKYKKVRPVFLLLVLAGLLFLNGCQGREDIEDKNYVLSLGMEKGEDKKFRILYEVADLLAAPEEGGSRTSKLLIYEADSIEEAEAADRLRSDKKLDFGHMKGILISEELLHTEEGKKEVLKELQKKDSFAGTTLLFFTTEDEKKLMELGKEKGPSFGEYVEKMVGKEKAKTAQACTLSKWLKYELERYEKYPALFINMEGGQLEMEEKQIKNDMFDKASEEKEMVRFHIRANSDKLLDQVRKIKIKNRILPKLQNLIGNTGSKEECMQILQKFVPVIREWVEEACEQEGYGYEVTVSLGKESFPVKAYQDWIFPKGTYSAFRIDLGEGQGSNWWCMLYPNGCGLEKEKEKEEEGEEKKNSYPLKVKWKLGEWIKASITMLWNKNME